MSLAQIAIEKRAISYFTVFLVTIAGVGAFFSLGQLEDPEFTVKNGIITTLYPGASPEEVELEVTDRIELALQEMPQVDNIESFSRAGMSLINLEVKAEYWSDRLPQVWDELRRKVRDTESQLPPGCGRPDVTDDFGDVFGFQLAVVGDGFTYAELHEFVKTIKKELSLVDGVARVDLWGDQDKAVYVDVSQPQLAAIGLTENSIAKTLNAQNLVVDGGGVDVLTNRMRIAPTGEFKDPSDIARLNLRPSTLDLLLSGASGEKMVTSELTRVGDISEVKRGYISPPRWMMRYNGQAAIGISITNNKGLNVVKLGERIDAALERLIPRLPTGIEVQRIHWQSDIVRDSVAGFLINFGEAVGIVLVVLTLAMGWRLGLVIGTALVLTILGSFLLMAVMGIDLQRMSLGALVIALGMMVDNAIVVADGFVVRVKQGMDRTKAAIEAASTPSMPLLGATVIAVMAFYPIFASQEGAGEYCRTLFSVVGISLLISWVISVTVTPLQCIDMLPAPKEGEGEDPYGGRMYGAFRKILRLFIGMRWLTVASLIGLLLLSGWGFGNVKQMFFPDSSMPKFMIDYWAPEGTRIQQVAASMGPIEKHLLADERIKDVTTFVGQGPPRFYLPVDPESPYASFSQLIVNVHNFRDVDALIADLTAWFKDACPEALVPIRKYGVGPSNTWKFEVRISGPAVADPNELRRVATRGMEVLNRQPLCGTARTNWRQRVYRMVPDYNEERARWATVTRDDIANATKRAFDGVNIGLFRERDELIPIMLRLSEKDRLNVGSMDVLQIRPEMSTSSLPMSQVINGLFMEWEDPLIWRRDRRRTITIQANPIQGVTLPSLRAAVLEDFEAIERDLKPGYRLEWGAEYEDTVDSQSALIPGMIPTAVIIAFIIVALFNAFRPPLIILCTIPFAAIGITTGLLTFSTPFGFLALLGAMSLAGMMIKNAIVLLDQIHIEKALGKDDYAAVVDSAVSRLRPVALAAATTVLGLIPLLQDVFWIGMAVTVMAGLTFGTVLTMIMVPVFYSIFYRVKTPSK